MLAEPKHVDTATGSVIAVPAKLDDERVRKEVVDTLRLLEGAKAKLRLLLIR